MFDSQALGILLATVLGAAAEAPGSTAGLREGH